MHAIEVGQPEQAFNCKVLARLNSAQMRPRWPAGRFCLLQCEPAFDA